MNNKQLLISLILLCAFYALYQTFSSEGDRSFKTDLVVLDTARVDKLLVYEKGGTDETALTLVREDALWIASKGNQNVTQDSREAKYPIVANLWKLRSNASIPYEQIIEAKQTSPTTVTITQHPRDHKVHVHFSHNRPIAIPGCFRHITRSG